MPEWSSLTPEIIDQQVVPQFMEIRQGITSYLKHPRLDSFIRLCRRYTVLFLIIRDIYDKYPATIYEILTGPKQLEEKIREACDAKYKQARVKLRRSARRSIIYILLTKMALAFVLELPVDIYWTKAINYTALAVNVLFPPFLMFLAALFIRVPSENNTLKIIRGVRTIVYSKQGQEIPLFLRNLNRGGFLTTLFTFVYAFMFLFTFGLLILFLRSLHFNALSTALFLFFLCVVSFFAFRIRQSAREMVIEGKRDRIRTVVADFISLPFLRAGRWLSQTFSRVNVMMFFLDFFIEAPFKSFIEITEDLLAYIREKKEEV